MTLVFFSVGLGAIVVLAGYGIGSYRFNARGQLRKFNPLVFVVLTMMIALCGAMILPDAVRIAKYGWYAPVAVMDGFHEHQSDFVNMAKAMQDLGKDYSEEEEIILWRPNIDDAREASLTLSSGSSAKVALTDEQMKYLEGISETFETNYSFSRIIVTDGRVDFLAEGNLLAIVYSVRGERPAYILSGENTKQAEVLKMDPNWFLLIRK